MVFDPRMVDTLEREIVADPRMVGTLEREQSRMVYANKADTT